MNGPDIARNAPAVNSARLFVGICALIAGTANGCTTAPTTVAYTPITGVQLLASDITAGHGCGTGPEQVYKYAAVVSGSEPESAVTYGAFDCFADAIFSSLPALDGGAIPYGTTYSISVFAYNRDSYPSELECVANAATCAPSEAGAVATWKAQANWTALCSATQIAGVTAVAVCGALQPADAGALEGGSGPDGSPADGGALEGGSGPDGSPADSSPAD